MKESKIQWTGSTWNPTTGCSKVSSGCAHCYAEKWSNNMMRMGKPKYKDNFKVTCHEFELNKPYTWKKGKLIFVNSMSDLFHEEVPLEFIKKVFKTMNDNPRHTFQVLTKRAERLLELSGELFWTDNIWMGVSVENEKVVDRIDYLRQTPAKVKFLSCEPLLGPLPNMNLEGIDWVIVGGESGSNFREMEESWAIEIRNQCDANSIDFFFKQWSGNSKKKKERLLDGKVYNAMPTIQSEK